MEHVTPSQAWGVSAGVLAPAHVALKNGWYPASIYGGWQVNSIGEVLGRHRDYLIAVLGARATLSFEYGVATCEGVLETGVWRRCRRRAPLTSPRGEARPRLELKLPAGVDHTLAAVGERRGDGAIGGRDDVGVHA